jgi:hypothetical protein
MTSLEGIMHQPPVYMERIVAFVDILGFGTLVSSLPSDPELHGRLHGALTYIKSYRESSQSVNSAQSNLEISVFSDSIAISSEPVGVFRVIWACGWLNAQLLYSGILTRGGISVGPTIHKADVLYGEGMLKAVQIESGAAVYPRIVVDPDLLPNLSAKLRTSLLDQDSDGLWFVDPFKFDAMPGGAEDLAADGYDPREVYFEALGKHVASEITKTKQVDHLAKWNWLAKRYRVASEMYSRNRELNLEALRKAAEQSTVSGPQKL